MSFKVPTCHPVQALALVGVSACFMLSGCVTPKEKREMQGDIFEVKSRLLNLENTLNVSTKEAKNTGESAAKRVASTQADLERMNHEISQIRGDIDALKVGVATGKMPGARAEDGSVADSLTAIGERVEAIEQAQAELMEALKKAGLKAGSGKGKEKDKDKEKEKKTTAAGSAKDLQEAYDAKHYKLVAEEAPKLLKKADAKEKPKLIFLNAESLFKLGKMREAALKYNDFLESKPDSKMIPVAKIRIGDCFRKLGDAETARVYYEELIKEFPDSDEAAKAKERLAKSGGSSDKG